MGALLSIPLLALPSVSTIGMFFASCCGAATCSAICNLCGKCQNSLATRVTYAFILLVNSILSWVLLTDYAIKKLEGLTMDYFDFKCAGKDCHGFVAVHRINFALGLFHAILAVILLGVKSSRDSRASIQNGFWGLKILAWIGLVVATFFLPDGFFVIWGNYFAYVGAILFLLLGLILLVDLAHTWAEHCQDKIEYESSKTWALLLVCTTLFMYLASIAMTVIMYVFFAHGDCSMNQMAITINFILSIIVSVISIHPSVQASNPRAGLAQSAMVAVYSTYLTMSAVGMEPDDQNCNPLIRNQGTRKASIIIGAVLTFVTVAYTTTRAATYGLATDSGKPSYEAISTDDSEHGLVTQQLSSRREMRTAVLVAAVESGSLPSSTLDDDSDIDSDDGHAQKDDERSSIQYNYTVFHIIFLLSTAWVATLLTMNVNEKEGDFAPVGRTYWASWVKIVSSWVCYAMYAWSLIAPLLFPDRFDS